MIASENEICNLSLSELGISTSVEDIRNPRKPVEASFLIRYDNSRRYALKLLKPNFAIKRIIASPDAGTPITGGFSYCYSVPNDCLSVLGFGAIQDRKNNFSIENNKIYTDEHSDTGVMLRYIEDETDVTKYSPEFIKVFAIMLAKDVCMQILQSNEKLGYLDQRLVTEMSCSASMNSQENRPIRISRSKFEQSKYTYNPTFEVKL